MSYHEKDTLVKSPSNSKHVLVIHGGAGILDRKGIPPQQQHRYKAALQEALRVGHEILRDGGEAMDAVTAAVSTMEDCPLFNAGKGAVFNTEGKNELEASLMLSKPPTTHPEIPSNRRGISATLLTRMRNPSQLVRSLYLSPSVAPHTFLSGVEAERIGLEELGQTLVDPSYFWTEKRWREHRRGLGLPEEPLPHIKFGIESDDSDVKGEYPSTGTVGAVALDSNGCIAALTSTGGKTNKLPGRIGDTPLMGSGFWAEEWTLHGFWRKMLRILKGKSCKKAIGISGTGDGDYFIRMNTASSAVALMKYSHRSLAVAAAQVVEELRKQGGSGGLIALDSQGNVALPMNSSGMFRGVIREDGVPKTAIFDDDVLMSEGFAGNT